MKSDIESYFQREVKEDLNNCLARKGNKKRNKEISKILEELK
jgi:hypothetical protein